MEIEYGFYDDKLYIIIHGTHMNPWNWEVEEETEDSFVLSTANIIPKDELECMINEFKNQYRSLNN